MLVCTFHGVQFECVSEGSPFGGGKQSPILVVAKAEKPGAPLFCRLKSEERKLKQTKTATQPERHQTKGLMSRAIVLHVRIESWYIF